MRLSGLASGFDTDSMVRDLMRVERMKVDRFNQQRQVNLWRQESYNKTNKTIANFILNSKKNAGLNKVGSTGIITPNSLASLDYIRKVTSSDESVATAKLVGRAENGDFSFRVEKMAEKAKYTSGEISSPKDLVINTILEEGATSLNIAGEEIEITEETTINDLIKEIKSNANLKAKGVSAFYDSSTSRVFIQADALEDGGKLLEGNLSEAQENTGGQMGSALVNGFRISSKNNSYSFNGLEIKAINQSDKDINISVNTDTESIIDKVRSLVEEYNTLLDGLAQELSQVRYKDYHPLSQEEKQDLSDRDVELWEEKAKSGMLNNDETINRMMDRLRSDLYKEVKGLGGSFKHLTEIGLSTEKYSRGATGGRLQIDEEKLRLAIEDDADGVVELLFGKGQLEEEEALNPNRETDKGIFTGIYDNLITGMKGIIDKSGVGNDKELYRSVRSDILLDFVTSKGSLSDIDRDISSINKRIADMEVMLMKKEENYYRQFTAMEKYMYEMNSQSQWLMQQMM